MGQMLRLVRTPWLRILPLAAGSACGGGGDACSATDPGCDSLAAPSHLAAVVVSVSEIALTWRDNATGEGGFELERAASPTTPFALVAAPGPNTTTYRDLTVTAATGYSYRVRAINASARSAYSQAVSTATPEARVIVENLSDVLNGDVASPVRLAASPGPDGISLREAISAVSTSTVPYEITFAAALLGGTLEVLTPLPYLKARGTRLLGLRTSSGTPGITISAGPSPARATITVAASDVAVSFLRFTNLRVFGAIVVLVGPTRGGEAGPPEITNVRIEDNDFDNAGIATEGGGVGIGSNPGSAGTSVRGVTVARNRFHHFKGDAPAVGLHASGMQPSIEGVDIVDNVFVACSFSINVVTIGAAQAAIRDIRIVRNTFLNAELNAISLEHNGTEALGGTITRVLVSGNRFAGAPAGVQALVMWGGLKGGRNNIVSSVWFHNNIVERHGQGVHLIGGMGNSRDNRVENVQLANNTFYRTDRAVSAQANAGTEDIGNTIAGLDVRNSIFWSTAEADFWNEVTPAHVSLSITSAPAFLGSNGNFSADPLFTAPAMGDFRLQAGSPAIDKGTTAFAPVLDMFCRPRVGAPDLGALEFGSVQSICSASLPGFPANLRGH